MELNDFRGGCLKEEGGSVRHGADIKNCVRRTRSSFLSIPAVLTDVTYPRSEVCLNYL